MTAQAPVTIPRRPIHSSFRRVFLYAAIVAVVVIFTTVRAAGPVLASPVLFVTQVPVPADFTSVTAVFGNHRGDMASVARGGDLWIRYSDGALRNLTREAGFGSAGFQGAGAIAVREPAVHWSGTKALFSMVVGAPTAQYQLADFYWQIYEVTGLGVGETVVIRRVPNQPEAFNNISPAYATDDRILFTSDRPRNGQRHLYPQLDEYEEAPTVTGIWSLDPASGDLRLLNHTPSGAFSPSVDTFGRIVFVRWDHLQRDQQADADRETNGESYHTFNYSDESASALILTNNRAEIFPEPRGGASGNLNSHSFNHFFPWMIQEDGREEETLNHIGRHELGGSYRMNSFNDDGNLRELYDFSGFPNTNTINNFLQIRESGSEPGRYFGIDAPEFGTHAAGQVVSVTGAPSVNPEEMRIDYLTPRPTAGFTDDGQLPPKGHTGLYRSPLPLSDGRLAAIHTPETRADRNEGTSEQPRSRYDFRLKLLEPVGGYWAPGALLTPGLSNSVSWWTPDLKATYDGLLWELDPVEVRARPRPFPASSGLEAPERAVFAAEKVDVGDLQSFLRNRALALIVVRNATARDRRDRQQPFNLRVPGGTETIGSEGKVYDIAFMQLYQGDQIRGLGLDPESGPRAGRRVLAQRQHEPLADNPEAPGAPESGVAIAPDGSVAAFVPARRALSWQTTAPDGTPVVRERYWLTFQPGEIRTCSSCHGVNTVDQAGRLPSTNSPAALAALLRHWKSAHVPQWGMVTNAGQSHVAVTFQHQPALGGVTHVVELSEDLVSWQPASAYRGGQPATDSPLTTEVSRTAGERETIVVRDALPVGARSKRFLRLREIVE